MDFRNWIFNSLSGHKVLNNMKRLKYIKYLTGWFKKGDFRQLHTLDCDFFIIDFNVGEFNTLSTDFLLKIHVILKM